MVEIAVRIVSGFLDAPQDFFHGIRKTTVMLLTEGDEQCADETDDEVVEQYAQNPWPEPQRGWEGSPNQSDPDLHDLQYDPDDTACRESEKNRQQAERNVFCGFAIPRHFIPRVLPRSEHSCSA